MQIFKRLFSVIQRFVLGMATEIPRLFAWIEENSATRLFLEGEHPKKNPLIGERI